MSSILQPIKVIAFDAKNADHRKTYVNFLNTGKWAEKFDLEYPFTNLPSMIMFKLSVEACADVGQVDHDSLFSRAFVATSKSARMGTQYAM
jgi:hypothetical protein